MAQWTFITNHGIVLAYIAKHPESTTRVIASAINLTERTIQKIIAELEAEKYIERRRMGRNNHYRINSHNELRHDAIRDVIVEDFLKMLLHEAKPKVISEALGHASVAFTMDTYSHIIEGMQEDAMALLDEVLPAGINGVKNSNAKLTPTVDITLRQN